MERLAEIERQRRQREAEQKVSFVCNDTKYVPDWKFLFQIIEEEASKRIELLVKKRVEEELLKRKSEIEAEVNFRVESAKKKMEAEMMLELEKRREKVREEEQKREVCSPTFRVCNFVYFEIYEIPRFSLIFF